MSGNGINDPKLEASDPPDHTGGGPSVMNVSDPPDQTGGGPSVVTDSPDDPGDGDGEII